VRALPADSFDGPGLGGNRCEPRGTRAGLDLGEDPAAAVDRLFAATGEGETVLSALTGRIGLPVPFSVT
jgi:hypothetical protein